MKTGVLLINLGTPDQPSRGAVYRYLRQFLTDRRVIDVPWLPRQILVQGIIAPFRSGKSAKAYRQLWTPDGSPLKHYGFELRDMVQQRLGSGFQVELGMRYQQPSVQSAVEALLRAHVSEIVLVPLFPQYASATTGSVFEEVMRVLSKFDTIPPLRFVQSYADHPGIAKLFADRARALHYQEYEYYLFSFHGLPQRQLRKGDISKAHCLKVKDCCAVSCAENQFCYSAQCFRTAKAIAAELGLKPEQYAVCFQSRLGADPWTQPYTSVEIKRVLAEGHKKLMVFSPAFVADCLETIVEIGEEYREEFEEQGGEHLTLVPSLNDDPAWADIVTGLALGVATKKIQTEVS